MSDNLITLWGEIKGKQRGEFCSLLALSSYYRNKNYSGQVESVRLLIKLASSLTDSMDYDEDFYNQWESDYAEYSKEPFNSTAIASDDSINFEEGMLISSVGYSYILEYINGALMHLKEIHLKSESNPLMDAAGTV